MLDGSMVFLFFADGCHAGSAQLLCDRRGEVDKNFCRNAKICTVKIEQGREIFTVGFEGQRPRVRESGQSRPQAFSPSAEGKFPF